MHASYISLALFAIGAIAAPSVPKPSSGFGDMAGGFPFNPSGSSSVQDPDSDGFDNPFPAAMQALEQAESAQVATPTTSATHAAMVKATHAPMSFPAPAVSQAPVAAPAPAKAAKASPSAMSSASHGHVHPSAAPSAKPSAKPSSAKPSSAKASSSASPSSSAAPSPSAAAPAGPLGDLVQGLPLVGGLVGAPIAGLGLRR
ncbi:unnamed protein product [Penicillium salamii]|nr:unnamed protein product [Penicillium salamii]